MINLLPPEYKKELRAARINVVLRRYILFQIIAIGLLAAMIGATFFVITMIKAGAEEEITSNQTRASSYAGVEAEAKLFQSNLSTAKTILDNEVRYTAVILAIAKNIPSGVVMSDLNLDSKTFGQPTSLTAKSKTYDGALQLKKSFEESALFTNVRLETVAASDDEKSAYPINIQINVTIQKEVAKQ